MESSKVIHVHLKNPSSDGSGKLDYYFGSLVAIFSVLTKDDIGRSYESLRTASIARKQGNVFENKKCVIRIDRLIRNASGFRGRKKTEGQAM